MRAGVRSILKPSEEFWRTVEGVDRADIMAKLRTQLAAAVGVSITVAIKGGATKDVAVSYAYPNGYITFPIEVVWEGSTEVERVVLVLSPEEVTQEIMLGMMMGALK
jgi:hypothetical protein